MPSASGVRALQFLLAVAVLISTVTRTEARGAEGPLAQKTTDVAQTGPPAGDDASQNESPEEEAEAGASRLRLYGQVMTDAGYRTIRGDPDWYDVMRPTKLPAFEEEFGPDGETYFSVRQTRFGVESWLPAGDKEVYGIFEFDLFGVGDDAGQTTFRLRQAYLEYGQFGAGQYWSPFMDIDVFPNSLEYWGPNGMVFFRNIQIRWMPIRGDSRLTFALERPGASGDRGQFEERVVLDEVEGHFPLPELSAEYRMARDWGYVELAGLLRRIEWNDVRDDEIELSGETTGWGLNLSSNLLLGGSDTLRFQIVYGEGVENYMNDATGDIGIALTPGNPRAPIKGVTLPLLGIVAFLDHSWSDAWASSIGVSSVDIDNSDGQPDDAFAHGRYALVNLLHTPAPNVLFGIELQYGYRENFADGWDVDDLKVQISFKYGFSHLFGGNS